MSTSSSSNSVSIREYAPADHDRVRQIVRAALISWDISTNAYRNSWSLSKLKPLLSRLAVLGLALASVGLKAGLVAILAYEALVLCAIHYAFYYHYVESHIMSGLADPALPQFTTAPNKFLVAVVQKDGRDHVVGCVTFTKASEDSVELLRFCVDENFRGLGIGKKLTNALLKEVKASGHSRVFLYTTDGQREACAFYHKQGFTHTERLSYASVFSLMHEIKIEGFEILV